jgi:hypothetical protein
MVAALAGCGSDHTSELAPPVTASSSSPAVVRAATPALARPALCGTPEPARRDPFPFNRDAARRDSMLHFYDTGAGVGRYSGGAAHFDDLDSTGLAALIEARFIDPYDRQNAAPTVWKIFQFLCHHPQVRAMGYVISIDRPDYRTSLETVYANEIDTDLRPDAEKFCVDADEVTTDDRLECFWD